MTLLRIACPETNLFWKMVHPLHCGIDLDTPPVSRLTLSHLSAKHLIPPPPKHPFAFTNTLVLHVYLLHLPPAPPLSTASPFSPSLSLHFSFVLIYVYIFICTPTHLHPSLPLSSSRVAASLFSPPIKHSFSPSVTPSSRKMMPGKFFTLQKHLALIWSRRAEAGRALRF